MSIKPRTYESEPVDVSYDLKRCIHAEECVRRLNAVFDTHKRPWIQPEHGTADSIAETIHHCPSGALRYARKDGGPAESVPGMNTIRLQANGPLYVRGDITIIDGNETFVLQDTRVALCRCGDSKNKPFCDNSHKDINFQASATLKEDAGPGLEVLPAPGGKLEIKTQTNGSLRFTGNFTILNGEGEPVFRATQEWLCRCGGSANKPICDGTHKRNGFVS
jgi:CDGSH-type Zn-finger protein/uncharacterized Fe-S cluster protein YjdI